jgi:3-oxoacyl-[acyl-carrier protein] reductase
MKVLVTGGSRGIGNAIKDIFISKGHDVYFPNRQELNLNQPVNLTDSKFDIIINNAGINPLKPFLEISDYETMRVNYFAPLEIIQQCLPHMISNGYGRILNIGSIWINISKPQRSAYSASKAALHALTKSVTAEYAPHGILCNTLSPGYIGTDLTYQNNSKEQLSLIAQNIPVGRLGTPEEIGQVAYQLTVENTFITGQNIIIDGGYSCTAN